MNKIFSQIFSDKYANHKAIGNNFILWLMYRFAYPFAVVLIKLRLSPNQITTLSTAFAIFAFIALVREDGWILFSVCWGVSVLLDFCDGTVARMTGRVSKTAFRYDHMSDLFKICLMFLGAGIRYDNSLVWIISSTVIFLYMYYMVLNHDLCNAMRSAEKNKPSSGHGEDVSITRSEPAFIMNNRIRDRYRIVAWAIKIDFLRKSIQLLLKPYLGLHAALTTINGHTLLLFFLVPLGQEFVVWSFLYFGLVTTSGIKRCILNLLATQRP